MFGIKNFRERRELEGIPSVRRSVLRQLEPEVDFLKERPVPFSQAKTFTNLEDILMKQEAQKGALANINKEASEEDLYDQNGGTTLTLKIDNKLIIAADTRHSSAYTINSRAMSKIYRIGDFFITTTGFHADGYEIYIQLMYEIQKYESHDKIHIKSVAHLLHNILYSHRFFPLWSYCCLSGFEEAGGAKAPVVYSYDCVGSYDRVSCRVDGTATSMIQPLLDSWINGKNFADYQGISFDDAIKLVKKAFDSASERDVFTGDSLEIYIFDGEKTTHEFVDLRKD